MLQETLALFESACCTSVQDLADKIAQLNSAIDDVSAQLKAQDNGTTSEAAAAGTTSVPA